MNTLYDSASQWWVTYSPAWLLVLIFAVYSFSAISVILEYAGYSTLAAYYADRHHDIRAAWNITEPFAGGTTMNMYVI